jgi:stage V sporulation protein R
MNLTPELRAARDGIRRTARGFGLDFFEVLFELVSWEEMNEVASYGGFPIRYPHWRFGMEYERLSKGSTYGLSRIYELVINNDPCIAYLQEANEIVDQKLVMAHVYAHCDFFKNNIFFRHTNRKMVDEAANHAVLVRRHVERYGLERVEMFLDACLSLEDLVDPARVFLEPRRESEPEAPEEAAPVRRIRSKEYLDPFVNPPDFLEEQRLRLEEEHRRRQHFPERPERDILLFLLQHAPLQRWQQDLLEIVRDEAYYFLPQGQTKIMNEGWASYWHSRIMTEKVLADTELVDYADHCSGVFAMPPGSFNPYKVGLELWRDIEERWDKGRFGSAWEECDDHERKIHWDTAAGQGRAKMFEVRRLHSDVTFIDTFLTPDFCERTKLFAYRWNERNERFEIHEREFQAVKQALLQQLTNHGRPVVRVENANFENRTELLLAHDFQGAELDLDYARDTLRNLARVWGRPVHIETVLGERKKLLTHDGMEFREREL